MSLHISRFIDNVKAHEARGQRDFVMSMRDAKDLHGDITKLLLALQHLQENQSQNQQIEVIMSGGSFKST